MKHLLRTFLASLAIFIVFPLLNVKADRPLSEEEAFRFLQEAFDAQLAITENPRSMEEIEESLGRYFTKEYTKDFIEMNVKENMDGEGYLAYGTDFALYYIPFFTYDENTKLGYDTERDKWYVYEWFEESSEGPVSYDGHYEAVGLTFKDNEWAIDDYQISFDPEGLSDNPTVEKSENDQSEVTKSDDGIWGIVLGFIKYASVTPFASLGWISVE
ncbi:hypothetical protein AC622_13700 [Bacillus sp. FJAT-27916]|uniref:DUF3993 domain-containing protein n=1 Tax=Bacillus sp. FJAT-27916 TaxID=1679169 RepID=UPI000670B14D|nr:DUF3993 domain-containing protein [Bacillus sp. FJAT-27916]KMY45152.1 hypothetical protein AC622_13700 [Bacillus sp. FJAT-27916]